jgi:PAS domain S-box-containing protein
MNVLFIVQRLGFAIALSAVATVLVWLPATPATYLWVAGVAAVSCLLVSTKVSVRRNLERRDLIEVMPGFAWFAGTDGTVENVNSNAVNYTGKSVDELKNTGWADTLHPDDVQPTLRTWSHSLETGAAYDSECRFRRADGTYRWFRNTAQPIRDQSGHIIRWYGVAVDIDDRKRAEEASQASEQNLRTLLDSIPGMISAANSEGERDYANRRMLDYTGLEPAEATNLGMLSIIHPDDREATRSKWLRCAQTGETYSDTRRLRRFDGEYRWCHARMEPRLDEHGRIARWYGLMIDVDDQKRAEVAVRDSERQLRLLFETLPVEIWYAQPDGEVTYINQRLARNAGLDQNDLAAANRKVHVHPDDIPAAERRWAHARQTGESFASLHRLRRVDGTYHWYQVFAEPLRDEGGRIVHWYGTQTDVDEQMRLEESLRTIRTHLAHATQLATVAELSATIAHEINQPLAAVVANGYACQRWLAAEPPNLERARTTAERIVRDGDAAAAVVNRVRALFKRSPLITTALNLNEIITEMRRIMFDEASAKQVRIEIDLDEDLPLATVDRVQMQQVMVNLVRNGIEAMVITIDRPRLLLIRSRHEGAERVRVDVCDHGEGLANADKIFEPFFTTKRAGMGMGLAICRSIIEAHQGRLWATPNKDRGTTFSFTLPTFASDPE